jgi:anthranilate phosphoribosyltransferase
MILESLKKVVEREDLSAEEAFMTMDGIMSGKATDAQIAAFLTALRLKGETVAEITGFARAMREKVSPVKVRGQVDASISGTDREALVDTCGTGGDASNTFNISTATAFVVAVRGSRGQTRKPPVSSLCGSADVVEALGVSLELPPEQVGHCIDEVGIGFYAPLLPRR